MLALFTTPHLGFEETEVLPHMITHVDVLHVRKPEWDVVKLRHYLHQIPAQYHSKIMVHQHHDLWNEFEIQGVHFTAVNRDYLDHNYWQMLSQNDLTISTSFHEKEEITNSPWSWSYQFLSPVFDSISKKEYPGRLFNVQNFNQPIIALGGVSPQNMAQSHQLGYAGVGVLGSVWNHKAPLQQLAEIRKSYNAFTW